MIAFLVAAVVLLLACAPAASQQTAPKSIATTPTATAVTTPSKPEFPQRDIVKTRTDDVVDDYHGEKIKDPYRWLEDGAAKEVEAWTEAENARTRAFLDGDPRREKLHARLDELLTIGFVSSPLVRTLPSKKKRYFYVKREGKQDQPIVYVREGASGEDRALLDPTKLSEDKTAALDWWFVSPDGEHVAYGVSTSGDEQSTLHVRVVSTGKDLGDAIPRTRASYVSWHRDGKRFYYTRLPEVGSVPKDEEQYHRKIYLHLIGDDPKKDALIYGDGLPMTDWPAPMLSPSGRWLIAYVGHGPAKTSLFLRDTTKKDAAWVTIVDGPDAIFMPTWHLSTQGEYFYIRSNDGAPNYEIYKVDPQKPTREQWKKVIAEGATPIREVDAVGQSLYVGTLDRARSKIARHSLDGKYLDAVKLPDNSSASVPSGEPEHDEALFEVQSYTSPPKILRIPGANQPPSTFAEITQTAIDTSQYTIEQIEAVSPDGAKVTAFVVHLATLKKDGKNPALLYGYGGFNNAQTPVFNRTVYTFLERGGVYAVANLRGGGEYGEAWHRAGTLGRKQNTFNDAIAVAERLVELGYTTKERLAVQGGSNGGLLVAALITQRPDLFRAALCMVPLTDMLRYQRFLLAKLWIPEYGSSDNEADYQWLKAYSPYHHVAEKVSYPATLVMTGVSDSRVDPLHARKFAARLQASTSSEHPVLLRVESKAGHGQGKPRTKQLEELADQYTFLFTQLGVDF